MGERNRRRAGLIALGLLVLMPSFGFSQESVRTLRSEVGAAGTVKDGAFVMETPRDSFTPGVDKQVVVFFEWEGTPGTRRCEVAWTSPDGTVAMRGQVDLQVKGRKFASHFTLLIPDRMAPGLWAAEAFVDGKAAGTRTFRVMKSAQPELLGPEQLYKLGMDATVKVEAIVPPGASGRTFSGFVTYDNVVLTTFDGVDGATGVRVTFQDGTTAEATGVLAFSREYDWAMLRVAVPQSQARLKAAKDFRVGDRYAVIQWTDEQRVVSGGSIVGRDETKTVARVVLDATPTPRAVGSP